MLVLMLSLALSASAPDAAAAEPVRGAASAKPAKPKKVCQRIESTGSSVPKKVCRTVEAPKVETEAANSATDKPSGNSTN